MRDEKEERKKHMYVYNTCTMYAHVHVHVLHTYTLGQITGRQFFKHMSLSVYIIRVRFSDSEMHPSLNMKFRESPFYTYM